MTAAGFRVRATDHRAHARSVTDQQQLGVFGAAGFPGLIADVAAFGAQIAAAAPRMPVFLIAHSMGSIAAQHVILDHSDTYAGVVFSGSSALDVLGANMAAAAKAAAHFSIE